MVTRNKSELFKTQNPLLNSLILETIFGTGEWTVDELKNFRLVCSTWYDATLNYWSSTACVVLNGSEIRTNETTRIPNPASGSGTFKGYTDYRNEVSLNSTLKYKMMCNYKLVKCTLEDRNEDVERFWERFAPNIKHLTMQECFFETADIFKRIVYFQTPNVECLVLNANTFGSEVGDEGLEEGQEQEEVWVRDAAAMAEWFDLEEERRQQRIENPVKVQSTLKSLQIKNEKNFTTHSSFTSFLAHFPSLEEIKISSWQSGRINRRSSIWHLFGFYFQKGRLPDAYMTEGLWNSLYNIRRTNPTRLRIKKLDIMHLCADVVHKYVYPEMAAVGTKRAHGGFPIDIGDANLPLEHLSIDIGIAPKKYVKYIIKSHAETLQVLKLFRAPHLRLQGLAGLPVDYNLAAMTEVHLFGDIVTDVCFLKWMPNLQVLYIERWCYTKREKLSQLLENSLRPPKNQNHLLVKKSMKNNLIVDLQRMKEFDIDSAFDSRSIHAVAGWMPNLKILRLILTNETLGVVIEAWPELRELTVKFESDVDDDGIKKLVGLKHLRKFKLEAYCSTSRLTNVSAKVFESMGHLTDLEICVSKQMNKQSERRLKTPMRNVKVIRNYGNGDHGFECCDRMEFHNATRLRMLS